MTINLISGPRNISTALMYSFAQRNDTKVIDEPFYAYYLQKTGINHPAAAETIASMSCDPKKVIREVSTLHKEYQHVFIKNMAHHHIGFDWSYLNKYQNVFLIRDPKQLIASFSQVIKNPTIQDIGLKHEAELFDYCQSNGKYRPIVIDSNDLLSNPAVYISELCNQLGISFADKMLQWKAGSIPEDGIWASYWYKNVHNSTGFAKQKTSSRPLDEKYLQLYEESLKYFQKLLKHKL